MNVDQIDSNLNFSKEIGREDAVFFSAGDAPFAIFGTAETGTDGVFAHRLPSALARSVSDKAHWLSSCGAGVRVRFQTDSPYIGLRVELTGFGRTQCDTLLNSAGCVVYAAEPGQTDAYAGFVAPGFDNVLRETQGGGAFYAGTVELSGKTLRDITVFLPTLSAVRSLHIGLQRDSQLIPARPYRYPNPVVYYGSSITMGVGASRPSNSYPAMISTLLDCDFVNLGLSGNARGETQVAEYIAELPMSAFVYDYDHNAPTPEFLAETHERFFQIIRQKRPELPIIMLSRPDRAGLADTALRAETVLRTFMNAKKAGDERVWFISGMNLFDGSDQVLCTVDGTHPNDLGYRKMAEAVAAVLKPLILR